MTLEFELGSTHLRLHAVPHGTHRDLARAWVMARVRLRVWVRVRASVTVRVRAGALRLSLSLPLTRR